MKTNCKWQNTYETCIKIWYNTSTTKNKLERMFGINIRRARIEADGNVFEEISNFT
jgi:hypothetical protein